MPKIRTNRSIKKRFRVTSSGKLKRAKAFRNHILTKKPAHRKAKLAQTAYADEADAPRMRRAMGM